MIEGRVLNSPDGMHLLTAKHHQVVEEDTNSGRHYDRSREEFPHIDGGFSKAVTVALKYPGLTVKTKPEGARYYRRIEVHGKSAFVNEVHRHQKTHGKRRISQEKKDNVIPKSLQEREMKPLENWMS